MDECVIERVARQQGRVPGSTVSEDGTTRYSVGASGVFFFLLFPIRWALDAPRTPRKDRHRGGVFSFGALRACGRAALTKTDERTNERAKDGSERSRGAEGRG